MKGVAVLLCSLLQKGGNEKIMQSVPKSNYVIALTHCVICDSRRPSPINSSGTDWEVIPSRPCAPIVTSAGEAMKCSQMAFHLGTLFSSHSHLFSCPAYWTCLELPFLSCTFFSWFWCFWVCSVPLHFHVFIPKNKSKKQNRRGLTMMGKTTVYFLWEQELLRNAPLSDSRHSAHAVS